MPKSIAEQVAHDDMVVAIETVWQEKMTDLGFADWKFEDDNFFEQPFGKIKAAKLAKEQLRDEIIAILYRIKIPD